MKRVYRAWTPRERAFVTLHYGPLSRAPWPVARIALELGRPPATVYAAAKRWALAWQPRGPEEPGVMARLYAAGRGDLAIARAAGCTRRAVSGWRRRTGRPALYRGWGLPVAAGGVSR